MATMRTDLDGNETLGEKNLYYRFKNKLSDDYHVWHNLVLPNTGKEADFIIFHPHDGIWVIEVKDWSIEHIINADNRRVLLKNNKSKENPFYQAWRLWVGVKSGLELKDELKHTDGPHQGNLVMPINYGVAFSNIFSSEIEERDGYEDIFPLKRILAEEFIQGIGYSDKDWENKLRNIRDKVFGFTLSSNQWNIVQSLFGTPVISDISTKQDIGVLDDYQEKLVKYKINKQIIIEGPAGSGKSIVLAKRALYIKKNYPDWDIGVFCFNATMANYLKHILNYEDKYHKITVSDYYDIQSSQYDAILVDEGQDATEVQLISYFSQLKEKSSSFTLFYDLRQSLYTKVELNDKMKEIGFKIENEKELVKQQRSVHVIAALTYYTAFKNLDRDIKDTKNEVLSIANRFFVGFKNTFSSIASGVNRFFAPEIKSSYIIDLKKEVAKRIFLRDFRDNIEMLKNFCMIIKEKVQEENVQYSDFLIIYPHRRHIDYIPTQITSILPNNKIPFRIIDNRKAGYPGVSANFPNFELEFVDDNRRDADLSENVVKAMTVHQSKGLDAKYVAIIGWDGMHENTLKLTEKEKLLNIVYDRIDSDELKYKVFEKVKAIKFEKAKAAELGYVALTRAKLECYIYYANHNKLVEILENVIK